MRGFLVDVSDRTTYREVDVEPTLQEYYKLVGCDCIDIAVRMVEGKPYNFVVDDEGLLVGKRIAAFSYSNATHGDGNDVLVGNALVFGCEKGSYELAPLDDRDVKALTKAMRPVVFTSGLVAEALAYD